MTLACIRVGGSRARIRFRRQADGSTGCEILDRDGELHIRRPAGRGPDRCLDELAALAGGVAGAAADAQNGAP